jgi:hypothetical protein
MTDTPSACGGDFSLKQLLDLFCQFFQADGFAQIIVRASLNAFLTVTGHG